MQKRKRTKTRRRVILETHGVETKGNKSISHTGLKYQQENQRSCKGKWSGQSPLGLEKEATRRMKLIKLKLVPLQRKKKKEGKKKQMRSIGNVIGDCPRKKLKRSQGNGAFHNQTDEEIERVTRMAPRFLQKYARHYSRKPDGLRREYPRGIRHGREQE